MDELDEFFGAPIFSKSKKDMRAKKAAERLLKDLIKENMELDNWLKKGKFTFCLTLLTYDQDYIDKFSDYEVVGSALSKDGLVKPVQAWRVKHLFKDRKKAFEGLCDIAKARGHKIPTYKSQQGLTGWHSNLNINL